MIENLVEGDNLLDKILLSEKDYEYLIKGIAIGVGIGIITGVILEDIVLYFALGGVIGILASAIISLARRIVK